MRRKVHLIVLYEGYRDRRFLQEYLRQCGYNVERNVAFRSCSRGHGSAEQSVRCRYASEVGYVRRYTAMNPSGTRWLVVAIDADTGTVEGHLEELDAQLPEHNRRSSQDPICILVPRRHTETWAYHLTHVDESVSETEDYKSAVSDDEVAQAGKRLAVADPRFSVSCPPSLNLGYAELIRLPC